MERLSGLALPLCNGMTLPEFLDLIEHGKPGLLQPPKLNSVFSVCIRLRQQAQLGH